MLTLTVTHVHDVGLTITNTIANDAMTIESEEDAIGYDVNPFKDSDGTDGAVVLVFMRLQREHLPLTQMQQNWCSQLVIGASATAKMTFEFVDNR